MEIFTTIVEAGQLTKAADVLNLSKSAVSHALSDLEKYLNLQLISRNNRSWQLTDAGRVYYEQCKVILTNVAAMEDGARRNTEKLTGHIRLSAPDTFGSYTLTPIIAKFMEKNPDVVIEMSMTERFVDLVEERVDIAFRVGKLKDSTLVVRHLGLAEMIICVSPQYLAKFGEPKTHLDLRHHRCLRYARAPSWTLTNQNKAYIFTPKDHIVSNSGETLREFCASGQGIAYLPTILIYHALKKGRLVRTLKNYEGQGLPISAVRIGNNREPMRVLKLLDFIEAELKSGKHALTNLNGIFK